MFKTDREGFSRRNFLQIGFAGMLGLTLPTILVSEARAKEIATDSKSPKAKSVILVWLSGGPATIDMWDNKPEAPEGIRGEFQSIDTKAKGVGMAPNLDPCTPDDIGATIFGQLGIKSDTEIQSPTGRSSSSATGRPSRN